MEVYDPLQWPPKISAAQVHLKCSRPGIDNREGDICPCCGRYEKLQNSKWPSREIIKDFRAFGGGIPAYFSQLKYLIACLGILSLVIVVFHIYLIETVCPQLEGVKGKACTTVFGIFKFCDAKILYEQLDASLAEAFAWLQLAAYLLLVLATIGIKIWLQHLNHHSIVREEKIFSKYSLILKNIPKFFDLQNIKNQINALNSNAEIVELFYIHRTSDLCLAFKQYFDLYYRIKHAEESFAKMEITEQALHKLYKKYLQLDAIIEQKKHFQSKGSKRAIIVFNSSQQRNLIYKKLRINEWSKSIYYLSKLVGLNTQALNYFAEPICEPQQIHWKYIGQSSTFKAKVRIQTTFIGVGFMLVCFGLFYLPMIKADEEKTVHPSVGTAIGLVISIAVIVLAVVYRAVIVKLMPRRRPSSKMAESYFVVITTVVFHFFFYLVTPAAYFYFVQEISPNVKLKQLFLAAITYVAMTLLVAIVDLKYLTYNQRKKKLLFDPTIWRNYCQQRLHQQLNPPSFPIQLKLMVLCNLWSFNAFYIFEIPYLLLVFTFSFILLFWIDKRNLYKHYKMQSFLSITLELKVQKIYIVLFLLCLSGGFLIASNILWHRYATIGIFVAAIVVNETLNYTYKHRKQDKKDNADKASEKTNLRNLLKDPTVSFRLAQNDHIRDLTFLENVDNHNSLNSTQFAYGYQQQYQKYLSQFKNTHINEMLSQKAQSITRKINNNPRFSEMVGIKGLQQRLLANNSVAENQAIKGCSFKEEIEKSETVQQQQKQEQQNTIQIKNNQQQSNLGVAKSEKQEQKTLKQQVKQQENKKQEVKQESGQMVQKEGVNRQ